MPSAAVGGSDAATVSRAGRPSTAPERIRYPISKIAGRRVYVTVSVAVVPVTGQPVVLTGMDALLIVRVPPSLYVPVTWAAPDGAKVIVQPGADEFESTRPAFGKVMTILSPVAFGSGRPSSPAPLLVKSFSLTDHLPLRLLDLKVSVNPRLSVQADIAASPNVGGAVPIVRVVPVFPVNVEREQLTVTVPAEVEAEKRTVPALAPMTVVPVATLKVSAPSSVAWGAAKANVVLAATADAMPTMTASVVLDLPMASALLVPPTLA
jgi:hypothetical protein